MKRSEFNNFDNFYNDVINNKNKNTDKKQFNAPTADGLNIRVPHDTVLHSEKEHTLTSNEWKDLLSNIDNIESAVKSHQKPRYSGIPVLLKIKTNIGCYGVVLEIFQKNNPIITTAFTDVESEIDNWIKVEAIPNGTETTFSDTRLNNIITHYAPNFKPKTYNETLYQSAVTAGAETSAEISDAQKEWQEKGTDSKYFKKWFGDSKVVDENGQPLVVYHGTLEKFNKFDKNSIGNRFSYDERGFFFTSSKNIANDYSTSEFDSSRKGYVMPVYISAKTPLVIDEKFLKKEGMGGVFKQEDSISFWDNYQDFVLDTFDEGNYDGIIINDGDTKMVVAFEPTQIKSVDNQGTFDESNPNIYYQTGINQGEITNIDGSIVKDVSNPLDYDYLNNQVTGEKVAIEINQDIKVEEIKPQNISSDLPFNVSKKTSENKKAIKQILNIDKGKILNLTNSATNESVEFKGTTIDESISKISINDGRYNDCCLILCNSKKLFETSQKILSHNDVKKVSDLKYSRYANIAQINDKQYLLEFVIKGRNKLALYSITPIKNDIAKRVDKSSQHDIAINSIAHIQDVF